MGRGAAPVRVLIIDDSSTIRSLIRSAIVGDPRLRVVGEAADPVAARALIRQMAPDVLTLDIEMPHMNGLTFLKHLMRLRPMPVVMLSSGTAQGSAAAIEALANGAVDCLCKADLRGSLAARLLVDRLVAAAASHPLPRTAPRFRTRRDGPFSWNGRVVLIGASTGGVDALETVLGGLPAEGPPVLVAQHMPAPFIRRFAQRLSGQIRMSVEVAQQGMPVQRGRVLFAPGGGLDLVAEASALRCGLRNPAPQAGISPSVDALFTSALPFAQRVVAVLLTGMGRDGAVAMGRLRVAGARCLAQDAASSVVFGMPGAALATGAAERAVPLRDIAECILDLTGQAVRPGQCGGTGIAAGRGGASRTF